MLKQLQGGAASWAVKTASELTKAVTLGSAFDPWPKPDNTFHDPSTQRTLAIEFKPPGHNKREYVTGLGQCLTYLNSFDYAVLVTPFEAIDGFGIAEYLGATVRAKPLDLLPVAILAYTLGPDLDMTTVEALRLRKHAVPSPVAQRPVFWGYWRDLSQHDVFDLLQLLDRSDSYDKAWAKFWALVSKGKARTWDGSTRVWGGTAFDSNKLNSSLALRHASLMSSSGRLTQQGLELLQVGKIYGPDSAAFLDALARRVLLDAHHLELIYWIDDVQRSMSKVANKSGEHYDALDAALIKAGVISPPTGHAKKSYLRDEPKLWNALGLLQRPSKTRYFWPGAGLVFNWRRITSIVAGA